MEEDLLKRVNNCRYLIFLEYAKEGAHMKVKLIYNPVAGNGLFKRNLNYIIDRFQKNGQYIEAYSTNTKKSIDSVLSSINDKEYKKVLVAGGDGTINKVVNGLMKFKIDLPMGILPVGTSNDYSKCFRLPKKLEDIVEVLLADEYTYSDVGLLNNQHFINVASFGRIIDVSHKTKTEFKNSMGMLAYYINGLSELPKLKPISVRINSEEINYDGEILFMLIMNGRSAGGFKRIAPCASINDGLFEVIIFKKCPAYELIFLFMSVISGEHLNNSNIIHFKTNKLIIDSESDITTDLDGEKGPPFPLSIKVIPKKIKIITRVDN